MLKARFCSTLLLFGLSFGTPAMAAPLSVLTWEGYQLPEFYPKYTAAHPEGINITTFSDDNEALAKVRSGFLPDVAHPCTFKLNEWKQAGLLQPIDIKRVKNWSNIMPALRSLPGVVDPDGAVWMVPWDWGNTSIIYRTDLVKEDTDTWQLLWDKKYTGRLAALDASDTTIVAAMLAGVDPFKANDADIQKIVAKLREQRPLLRYYTADQSSLAQSIASGELVAAMAWNAAYAPLKSSGVPVAFMKPKEGMLTWVCGLVILKNSKNIDAAYDYINANVDPGSEEVLMKEDDYGGSLQAAFDAFTPQQLAGLSLPADPATTLSKSTILQPQMNSDKIMSDFEAVKAGD
jgi:spermidine/putrescine transport system substrate-binding protein